LKKERVKTPNSTKRSILAEEVHQNWIRQKLLSHQRRSIIRNESGTSEISWKGLKKIKRKNEKEKLKKEHDDEKLIEEDLDCLKHRLMVLV